MIFEGVSQTVEITELDQFSVFFEKPDLFPDLLLLILSQFIRIQLISEGAEVSHMGPEAQTGHTLYLMVGYGGYMGSDRGNRVSQRGTVLDLDALCPVGIVAGPALRSIIHHARIKSGSAAGTGLK